MRFARWYRQRAMTDHLLLAQSTGAQPACAVSAMVHRTLPRTTRQTRWY